MERLEKVISHVPNPEALFLKLTKEEAIIHLDAVTDVCSRMRLPTGNFFYITSEDRDMFLLRKNTAGTVEDIADYGPIHLNFSIIRDIAIRSPGTTIAQTNYVLYYHWFYRYYKNYNSLRQESITSYVNRNVCVSLEDIISILVEKENTTYKEVNTSAIIQAYRFQCNKLKCIGTIQNINLRR